MVIEVLEDRIGRPRLARTCCAGEDDQAVGVLLEIAVGNARVHCAVTAEMGNGEQRKQIPVAARVLHENDNVVHRILNPRQPDG